jgi:hypothetical protein
MVWSLVGLVVSKVRVPSESGVGLSSKGRHEGG